jgi:transcriptional regulator with XRE-family HTH domain
MSRKLKKARVALGKTQAEMAEMIGVSLYKYRQYEKESTPLPKSVIARFSKIKVSIPARTTRQNPSRKEKEEIRKRKQEFKKTIRGMKAAKKVLKKIEIDTRQIAKRILKESPMVKPAIRNISIRFLANLEKILASIDTSNLDEETFGSLRFQLIDKLAEALMMELHANILYDIRF